jgi:predicted PurR-regulated permease PerM
MPGPGDRQFIAESGIPDARRRSPTAVTIGLTIAVLYFGRDILVPLAMAVLLSFMLAPVVAWLERLHLPRIPAVIGAVALAFTVISGFGILIADQLVQLAQEVPGYQNNLQEKVKAIKILGGPEGIIGRTSEMLQQLGDEVARNPEPRSSGGNLPSVASGQQNPKPIPVQIEQRPSTSFEIVQVVIGPLVQPLTTAGIIIVFVIFVLLQRRDIRDRFISLAGARDLTRTTQALEDAGERVARYLLMQLIVNVSYGVPVGIGLWLIGVPYPLLWGMMATILRFVPYIGPVLAAALPIALSIAVDPGWSMLLWTAALFIFVELVSNNIVEPWLYGSQTGLSPIAIIVAAIVWTWLWGPMGLLLSTPLTVCLVVLGRHVPQFAFLNVLLGRESVLTPEERLHQRLLMADADEATEQAEVFLKDQSLEAFYQQIAIPTMVTIEREHAAGIVDDQRRQIVAKSMFTLIENLSDHIDVEPTESTAVEAPKSDIGHPGAGAVNSDWGEHAVLCVGGRGSFDDVAAAILGQLLARRGIGAWSLTSDTVGPENLARLDMAGVRIVILSYVGEDPITHAKYLIRRIRRRTSTTKLMIGLWTMSADLLVQRKALDETRADFVAVSLTDALDRIAAAATGPTANAVATSSSGETAGDLAATVEAAGQEPV